MDEDYVEMRDTATPPKQKSTQHEDQLREEILEPKDPRKPPPTAPASVTDRAYAMCSIS